MDLLNLLGKKYLVDLAINIYNEKQESEAFRLYCSELLRSLNNSVAQAVGGSSFPMSWHELKNYKPETRSAKEIKTNILNGLHNI